MPDDHHDDDDQPRIIGIPIEQLFGPSSEQRDQMEMEATTEKHAIYSFIQRQNKDDLRTLQIIINLTGTRSELAPYYAGFINAILSVEHNVCPTCGESHDEKLGEIVSQDSR